MNIKNIIIIPVLTVFLFSCYQAPESSSGSVAVKLDSSVMRDAPAGFDGELRLAVFNAGDLDSLIDISGEPEISYLGDFPTPLLANNSFPVIGRSGVLSLLNVPSDKPLTLLVEYDGGYWDPEDTPYYHSYSGVSGTFEVAGGGTAEVAVTLTPTADSTGVTVNKGPLSSGYIRIYLDSEFDGFISLSGSILSFGTEPSTYISEGTASSGDSEFIYEDAILPGRKYRVIVSEDQGIEGGADVGITDTFELLPGRSETISATYYTHNSCEYFC